MNKILYGIIFAGVALLTFMGVTTYNSVQNTAFQAALPQSPAVFETSLQSPITSSATSMTLTANAVRGGGTLSGYNCFTLDEGSAQAEYTCGTVSGTSVTGMSRGVSPSTGTTTIASLQFSHRRGANVKITDFPVIQILKAQNNGEDTFPNLLTYANTVLIGVGSASTTIATKYYVDNVAIAGAANSSETVNGIGELATSAEAAASTSIGGTLARLLLPASLATSTPNASACGTGCIVVAVSGKIAQAFLDLTQTFTWTGLHTFSGASGGLTSTATTTISASNINSNPFILNALAYVFPSVRGVANSVLTEDASGGLTWSLPTGMLYRDLAPSSVSGSTATSSIFSTTIAANTLGANGVIYGEIPFKQLDTASGGDYYFDLAYGNATTTVFVANAAITVSDLTGVIRFWVAGNAATNSQRIILKLNGASKDFQSYASTGFSVGQDSEATIATDSTAAQVLRVDIRPVDSGNVFDPEAVFVEKK